MLYEVWFYDSMTSEEIHKKWWFMMVSFLSISFFCRSYRVPGRFGSPPLTPLYDRHRDPNLRKLNWNKNMRSKCRSDAPEILGSWNRFVSLSDSHERVFSCTWHRSKCSSWQWFQRIKGIKPKARFSVPLTSAYDCTFSWILRILFEDQRMGLGKRCRPSKRKRNYHFFTRPWETFW